MDIFGIVVAAVVLALAYYIGRFDGFIRGQASAFAFMDMHRKGLVKQTLMELKIYDKIKKYLPLEDKDDEEG